jgi:Zn-dependent peptidase ImmA (M78 family)/transcriptional regulator with XRE-family HTH domain
VDDAECLCYFRTVGAHRDDERTELGVRIAEGRALADLTQAQLAQRCGIERTALAKIESGTRRVSATELVAIAAALDRPADWFFASSPPAVVSRRADPAVGGRSAALDSRVERVARDVEDLIKNDVLAQATHTDLSPPGDLEAAERRAGEARSLLGLASEPLIELQAAAERMGLLAFSLPLGPSGGDAAYVALESWGVAVVNGSADPGRRRFNLAHELGHHLFGDAYAPEIGLSPQDETEKLINAFAINLLLPRDGVLAVWEEFTTEPRLAATALAVRFRVSWTAVCAQLRNLDLIDAGQREGLASSPLRKSDFVELGEHWVAEMDPPSIPSDYGRRVLGAYRRGKLTSARTVELLWGTVPEAELPEQAEIPIEALRRDFTPLP